MDNEQVRVCRCCGEAEVHMAACEERLKSDPLYAGGVVHEWQKQEMTASGAAMQRCKFVYLHSKTPPEVMASAGHASKQAMLDDDRVNMARNDLIDRIDRRQVVEREAGEVFAWWSEKVRAEYEERARFIEYARKRFAEEMYNHGASTGKPGSIMALEALLSRSPDGLTGGGS